MALTPNFSVSQSASVLSTVTVTDTSTGSDVAITQRRIYFEQASGSDLVPSGTTTSYVNFPLSAGGSIAILNLITQDFALSITVQWLDVSGTVLYEKTILYCFSAYGETFLANMTQQQAASYPTIINDNNYWNYKLTLRTLVDDAQQAVSLGADIFSSQSALDMALQLMNDSNFVY